MCAFRPPVPPSSSISPRPGRRHGGDPSVSEDLRPPGRDVPERDRVGLVWDAGGEGAVELGDSREELRETISSDRGADERQLELFDDRGKSKLSDLLQPDSDHRNGHDRTDKDDDVGYLYLQSRRLHRAPARRATSQIAVLRLHRDNPLSWGFVPYTLERIAAFCTKYDTDSTSNDAVDAVRAWFTSGDKRLGLWIAYDIHSFEILGHVWANPEPFHADHWKYMLIRQVDAEGVTKPFARQIFNELKDWTKSIGLSRIVILTHRSARAMTKRWGFKLYKSLMDISIEGDEHGGRR